MVVVPQHNYPENVLFARSRVIFSVVHVVGSENDLAPWSQLPGGDRPDLRLPEFEARQAAALEWIDLTFVAANLSRAAGVLLLMQAEPTDTPRVRQDPRPDRRAVNEVPQAGAAGPRRRAHL